MRKIMGWIMTAVMIFGALSALAGCAAQKQKQNDVQSGQTPSSATAAQSGEVSSEPVSGGEESSADESFDSIFDEQEDPLFGKTILTVGTYELPFAVYRYYYMSIKEQTSRSDPGAFTDDDKKEENYQKLKEASLGYCRAVGVYFTLAKQLNVTLPEDFDEKFNEYVKKAEDSLHENGLGFHDYFGPYMTLSVFKVFYALDQYLTAGVAEEAAKPENGLIDTSAEAIAKAGEEYRTVKHILVGYNDGLDDEAALARAKDLVVRLGNGEDIDLLMKEFSNDYHEGADNAYTFTRGEMVKEFEETAFSMEVGQISEPVKSTYGYHVILRLPLAEKFEKEIYPQLAVEEYLNTMHETIEVVTTAQYDNFEALNVA